MTGNLAAFLPFLRSNEGRISNGAVARQGGRLIPQTWFLAEIVALARQLPDRPHMVNLCADRIRFTVAWAAAMLRGQVMLLPPSPDPAAVAALCVDYPALYVLADHALQTPLPAPGFAYPEWQDAWPDAAGPADIPAFPPDQIAAILFTSGSTGRPTPHPRSWGRLVAGSRAAGAALGLARHAGAAVVATIPHAHSYGLESAIMLPLQHGLLLTAERPFFPADVAAALGQGTPPAILVTTPVHLRALVADATLAATMVADAALAASGPPKGVQPRAGLVISATAPLETALAAQAEAAFAAPVFEIYGCSEAGQLATRRSMAGPSWRCLQGFALHQDGGGIWVSGPQEPPMPLADSIALLPDGQFLLQGRNADMVNIAGKRGSLAHLTQELLAITGVMDGVVVLPPETASGAPARLAALVVAPGHDAAAILAALRPRIDPAFWPRPLVVVNALPRNAIGKLPRDAILRLLGQAESAHAAPLMLRVPADHPAGPGHFPGNPIVPGAVLLDMLVAMLFPGPVGAGWFGVIESAKFHHPVRPGDALLVTHGMQAGRIRFACRLAGSDQMVLSGALRSSPKVAA